MKSDHAKESPLAGLGCVKCNVALHYLAASAFIIPSLMFVPTTSSQIRTSYQPGICTLLWWRSKVSHFLLLSDT